MKTVLVGAPDPRTLEAVGRAFEGKGVVEHAPDFESALSRFVNRRYDFTFLDISLIEERTARGETPAEVLQRFLSLFPAALVVVITPPEKVKAAVDLVKAGAANYLSLPLNPLEIRYVADSLEHALLMELELGLLRDSFWQAEARTVVTTRNPRMMEVFEKVKSVAGTNATVLIEGETGTGKNVIAKLIHGHSPRKLMPFISVHCGAIPPTLIESELFGHEKGAFTGAVKRKLGRFEIARGGTIFLDEIGTTPPAVQVELLQILQEKTFTRVGGEMPIEVDVRIVAASNVPLKQLCDEGTFRRDLYYRLNVFPIHILPLRERLEDVPIFVESFLAAFNRKYGRSVGPPEPEVLEVLRSYSWPGNLRELENVIERAHILEEGDRLTLSSLPADLVSQALDVKPSLVDATLPITEARQRYVETFEQLYLVELLKRNRGRIGPSASDAGVTTRQLQKLMRKHGLTKEPFQRT